MAELLRYSPEWSALSQQFVNERIGDIAYIIREYSAAQTDTWRQLPYLALQAEAKFDNNHFNIRLFRQGLLTLNGYPALLRGTYVDCDNGNILSLQGEADLGALASDTEVVRAWLPNGESFNAEAWMNQLLVKAFKPNRSYGGYDAAKNQKWRFDIAMELDLRPIFSRTANPQEPRGQE